MTPFLDWQAFVSRFYPGSARHDYRVLKAYDAYRKVSLRNSPTDPGMHRRSESGKQEGGAA